MFHEKYHSTLVASTDQSTPTPAPTPKPASTPTKPTPAPQKDSTTTIDPVVTNDNDPTLQEIYAIIKKNIPDLDIGSLNADAQKFFETYGVEITHKLSTKTTIDQETNIELYIYNKATKKPYTGMLPITFGIVTANTNIQALPASFDEAHNGRVVIRLRGAKHGPSIVGFTVDNTIFYALPVLVE